MIEVRLETHPARRLLARSHTGDCQQIGATFERLMDTAGSLGLLGSDSTSIGIYYHDPDATPVDELRSHACVVVPQEFDQVPDGFEIVDLPAGEVAVGVHRGPYTELGQSYRWLFGEWLPSSGRVPADRPCYEIYADDPRTTKPEELRTLICIPLKASAARSYSGPLEVPRRDLAAVRIAVCVLHQIRHSAGPRTLHKAIAHGISSAIAFRNT